MTNTQIDVRNPELVQWLENHLALGNASQEQVGREIDMSGGVVSRYRKGTYNGNIENVEARLLAYRELWEKQQQAAQRASGFVLSDGYVPTSISERVFKAITLCHLKRGIVIIQGDAGIGKTKAAAKYYGENPATCVYVQCSPACGTLTSFFKKLSKELKVSEAGTRLEVVERIRKRLEGTNRVLIIDEAQHLKPSTLEELRTMGDPNPTTGKPGVGIVLMGNTEVYDRMLSRQEARFAQLFSRVRMNLSLSTQDITGEDVAKLFPALIEGGESRAIEFITSVCQSKWGVRGAVNVFTNSMDNEDISYKGLLAMSRQMGIGIL